MQYRTLGRTGWLVSDIGYGMWGMGGWSGSDRDASMNSLRYAVELGCNFFDTAWAYGEGFSDTLAGKLKREYPDRRLIMASKIPPKNRIWPAAKDARIADVFPRDHIFEYTAKTLDAAGLDSIEIMQFHVWDDSWAEEDDWKVAVEDLKRQGMIQAFGLSVNRWEPMNGAAAIHTGLIDTVQVIHNIFDQAPEDELFPLCQAFNVGVIARVPLDEGGLTGNLTNATRFPPDDWRAKYFGPENLEPTVKRAEALKELLPEGMTLPEMALRYVLSHPAVSTTIVGMRQPAHVSANIGYSDGGALPAELMEQLRVHRWDRVPTPWSD